MAKSSQLITLENVWDILLNDIEHLFQFQTIRYSKWMLLYTHIFNYCTNHKHDKSVDLYESFRKYLRNYLENFYQSNTNIKDEDRLEFYIKKWKKYCISSKILHGICSYLHRTYVKYEYDCGNQDICEIYPMAMQIWQQIIAPIFYNQFTQICLTMIKDERNHQTIDGEILRNMIRTYVSFDINEYTLGSENNARMLNIYQEYFEKQFLQDTQEFYRLQSITYLQQHTVIEYLLKIPQYFDEEIHRITTYLHPSTIKKLIKNLEEILIQDHLASIYSEAKTLFHNEQSQELNLLYQAVIRVENGKIPLINLMENHMYQNGIEIIEHINPIPTNDFKIYIQTIYNLHNKHLIFIEQAFNNDQEFIDALDRTYRKFINDNIVVQTIGNTTIMAENLAQYCDTLLRKKKTEEINVEIIFNQIKILLHYIQEKDVFEKFYSKLLAKRLINQMSTSNDNELLMISNIQSICSFEYAYKMKKMYQDIEISKNVLDQYHRYCETEKFINKINFNVIILSSNAWLFSILPNIILPNKLELICNNFNKFYNNLHNGKKLIWLHQHSKGELYAFFTEKMYTLQVSMYQMVVILLFNNSLEFTVEQIHDKTQIRIDLLLQILNSLIQSKIIICRQMINQTKLDENSIIKLSNDFISDKSRINLNIPIKSIEEKDTDILYKKFDHNRIMIIQARIVRIMKLHKTMNQNLLIQTVIEQLNSYFIPNISIIKNCINTLIENEYIARQSNNADILYYKT